MEKYRFQTIGEQSRKIAMMAQNSASGTFSSFWAQLSFSYGPKPVFFLFVSSLFQ